MSAQRRGERLPYLETFVRAAELGSFTAAARALGITQAAVSQRMQLLERTVGARLFRRQQGRVGLTEAGQRLHRYAQRLLALEQEARAAVAGAQEAPAGELILAASSIPGEYLLPELLARFQARYPHIHVRATVADTQWVLRQVERGQAPLGLVGGKILNPHLEYRHFATDRLVLVVPANHPWSGRRQVSLAELARQPLIVREVGSGSRRCLEEALARAGKSLEDLHSILELGSNETIKEAVQRGLGLAILSDYAVRQEVEAGKLHAMPVAGLRLRRRLYAVRDRRRPLALAARLFLDLLLHSPPRRT